MLNKMDYLKQGDKVAIIAPGSPVKPEYVHGACRELEKRGYHPVLMPHTLGKPDGIYASSAADRISDFILAWSDPEVKAILCARGGYGSVQLLPEISEFLRSHYELPPKWLIGFSDITVFHTLLSSLGIPSVHGPMAKNIAITPGESIELLFELLTGQVTSQTLNTTHPYNFPGKAEGILTGGNLATYMGLPPALRGNPEGKILFIEDVGEQIYEINRMLWRLHLEGFLSKFAGIVVGQFTEYRPDRSYEKMEDMIRDTFNSFGLRCPVIFDYPAGHIDNNLPIVMGEIAHISI